MGVLTLRDSQVSWTASALTQQFDAVLQYRSSGDLRLFAADEHAFGLSLSSSVQSISPECDEVGNLVHP